MPDVLAKRSKGLVDDQSVPLGTTESYPLPGVTTLIRVEPHMWSRDETGNLIQGCFRSAGIYLPSAAPSVESITAPTMSRTTKLIGGLTVVSLAAGIIATAVSLRNRGK